MKRKKTLQNELDKFGLVEKVGNVEGDSAIEDDLLRDEYDGTVWSFSPEDSTVKRPVYPEASLLGLPLELRLQILRYLLPDEDEIKLRSLRKRRRPDNVITNLLNAKRGIWNRIPARKREEKLEEWERQVKREYDALRKDLDSCWPAILAANRQLYAESSQITYGGRQFHAELELDCFRICSRNFLVRFQLGDYDMIETQLRHIGELRISVNACDRFCPEDLLGDHDCTKEGCHRKRKDGIRNTAGFLSDCVGLYCLDIDIESEEYQAATARRPLIKRELRRVETKILELIRPFASIRGLAWAHFYINGRRPRDIHNSRAEFCDELDGIINMMRSGEPVPSRTDLPLLKHSFAAIFTLCFDDTRTYMKNRYNLDVNALAEKCWQACENGDADEALQQHKELSLAWFEQKRMVDGYLEQIQTLASGDLSKNRYTTVNASKTKR